MTDRSPRTAALLAALSILATVGPARGDTPSASEASETSEATDVPASGEAAPPPTAAELRDKTAPPEAEDLHLVYSGGLLGLSPARPRLELQERLRPALRAAGITIERVEVLHGVLAQGDLEVWPEDGTVASALRYAASPATCDAGTVVSSARTPTERFLAAPGAPELPVPDATLEPRRWQRCEAGGVRAVALSDPAGPGAEGVELSAPDLRTAFRWIRGDDRWIQLARPRREPGRRAGVLRAALAATPGSLFVDAGDFVDPSDPGDPIRAARRQASYETLRSLAPTALGVGAAELAEGLDALLNAAGDLPYIATNWAGPDGASPLPTVRRLTVPGPSPLDVAFLAVTDPRAQTEGLKAAGVQILDPVDAVNAAVDGLAAGGRPDLVILLARLPPDAQADLQRRLRGVDLVLGDPTAATYRVREQITRLRTIGGAFKAAPVSAPMDGIAEATISTADGPTTVTIRPLEVSASAPSDPEVTRTATRLRAAEVEGLDRPLIPPDDPLGGVSEARWEKLVCEAVLEATGADVALLAALPPFLPTPGPLTALQVVDRLRDGEIVEVHRADGDRFKGFLYAAQGAAAVHCGAATGTIKPRAQGRLIDPLRTYRVATTDASRASTRLGDLLPQASSGLVGHRPQFLPLTGPDGEPATLDRVVLRALDAAASRPGWVEALEARGPKDKRPQWRLEIRRLALQVERFEGPRSDAYAEVPETALRSPSSFTLGGDADVALDVSSRAVRADLRFVGSYTTFSVDGLPPQETADAWRLSSSIQLPIAALPPKTAFRVMPFAELGFDSEFTPADGPDGAPLPRRADLSVFGGLSAARVAGLRSLRLGAFVNRDLGRLDSKLTEFGGRFSGTTFHSLLPLSALWLTTAWDAQVFAPTAADDASDLRLRLWGEVRAAVRVVRSLNLGLYIQGLLVQGRVASTAVPAGTVTMGLALDLRSSLRLDVRPRLFPAAPHRRH